MYGGGSSTLVLIPPAKQNPRLGCSTLKNWSVFTAFISNAIVPALLLPMRMCAGSSAPIWTENRSAFYSVPIPLGNPN